jgi:hypothetical protein
MSYAVIPNKAKVSKSVSTDQTRPALCSAELRLKGDQWVLEATDSYQLARVPLHVEKDEGPELTEGPIPMDALKSIEKTGAFVANGHVQAVDARNGQPAGPIFARPTRAEGYPVPADALGKWPDTDQLMPEYVAGDTVEIGLDAELLYRLAQALGKTGGTAKVRRVKVTVPLSESSGRRPNGAYQMLRPMLVEVDGSEGLLMPIRLP